MDTERGGKDTARASSDACPFCGTVECLCNCRNCVNWRASRQAVPCEVCAQLRELLRLALGKLRDVQRADVTGTVEQIETALDGVAR